MNKLKFKSLLNKWTEDTFIFIQQSITKDRKTITMFRSLDGQFKIIYKDKHDKIQGKDTTYSAMDALEIFEDYGGTLSDSNLNPQKYLLTDFSF